MNTQERLGKENVAHGGSALQEWITYPEAEQFTGLSHTTLWRYVSSGELKAARVGRSVRIHLPTLRGFMNEKARCV
jgi:excisionase family DNA binding protein